VRRNAPELMEQDRIGRWVDALERRYLRELSFAEIRRGVQALSSLYVERRGARLTAGSALDGRGKRAAFALFYAPLHLLLVTHIVQAVAAKEPPAEIVDLGCGTGVASAGWALTVPRSPRIVGVDKNGWALSEARWTWRELRLRGSTKRQDAAEARVSGIGVGVVAAFTVNEIVEATRAALLLRLLGPGRPPGRLLVVEPLARRAAPWWPTWRQAVLERGGREDEWRIRADLPEPLRRLDRAAGLSHEVLSARTLWL
jgi:hypothetical protein